MFLMIIFFSVTPITLAVSLFSIFSLTKNPEIQLQNTSRTGVKVYASLPKLFLLSICEFLSIGGKT